MKNLFVSYVYPQKEKFKSVCGGMKYEGCRTIYSNNNICLPADSKIDGCEAIAALQEYIELETNHKGRIIENFRRME